MLRDRRIVTVAKFRECGVAGGKEQIGAPRWRTGDGPRSGRLRRRFIAHGRRGDDDGRRRGGRNVGVSPEGVIGGVDDVVRVAIGLQADAGGGAEIGDPERAVGGGGEGVAIVIGVGGDVAIPPERVVSGINDAVIIAIGLEADAGGGSEVGLPEGAV